MEPDEKNAYYRTNDENGERILCPIDTQPSQNDYQDCVEESTTGRYAANITVVE